MSDKTYSFPDRTAPDSQKAKKEYGLQFFRAACGQFSMGDNNYYGIRNARILENRLFARGDQSVQPLLDLMGIDGKASYINIDLTPSPIAPKFKNVFIDWYMKSDEHPKVAAVDRTILTKKERKKIEAKFRVDEKEFVKQFQELSGINPKPPGQPEFDSEEEVDMHFAINDREREEILMEKLTNFVLTNNKWFPRIKRSILADFWDAGYTCVRNWTDSLGKIWIEGVDVSSVFHGTSLKDDLSDTDYIGHVIRMNISDFRIAFPHVTEREIFEIAKTACSQRLCNNSSFNHAWNESYYYLYTRPYDDVKIDVAFGWYKCDKVINYVKGTDSYGRKVFDITGKRKETKNPNKKSDAKRVKTAYTGYWIMGTDHLIDWQEERNQLRPHNNLEDILPPYVINMPDNNDGIMLPISPQAMIKPYIRHMDECIFKIRQIIAEAAPDGYEVDIDALENIDLGQGKGTLQPLELTTIYKQTGIVYRRSVSPVDGESVPPPITPIQTTFGGKLGDLISVYNFNLQQIRDVLGINEYREGQSVNPKTGLGVLNSQLAASNTATVKYYNAYLEVMKGTAKAIAQRLWDGLWYSARTGSSIGKEYFDLLGEDEKKFLDNARELTKSNYDVDIQVGMNDEEKMRLEANIQSALDNNQITLEDAVFVREVKPFRLAMKYLAVKQRKREEAALKAQRDTMEQQAQLNKQSAEATAQGEAQLISLKQEGEIQERQIEGEYKLKEEDKKFLHALLLKQFETEKPLPEYAQQLLDKYQAQLEQEEIAEEQARMMQAQAQQTQMQEM